MAGPDSRDNSGIDTKRLAQQMEAVPFSGGQLRTYYKVESARTMRAPGYPWEHEIRCGAPTLLPSYR
jgi:hypothetical protein